MPTLLRAVPERQRLEGNRGAVVEEPKEIEHLRHRRQLRHTGGTMAPRVLHPAVALGLLGVEERRGLGADTVDEVRGRQALEDEEPVTAVLDRLLVQRRSARPLRQLLLEERGMHPGLVGPGDCFGGAHIERRAFAEGGADVPVHADDLLSFPTPCTVSLYSTRGFTEYPILVE